jgi:hypothetical protein
MGVDGFDPTPEKGAPQKRSSRRRVPTATLGKRISLWQGWLSTLERGQRPPPEAAGEGARDARESAPPEEIPAAAPNDGPHAIAWQRLWLSTQRRPWRSLAVIAVDEAISTADVAKELARVGASHLGSEVVFHDGSGLSLERLRAATRTFLGGTGHVIIAVGPVLASPAALALARAADAALLCLSLGQTPVAAAARTVEEIGRERFLGAALLPRAEARR